MESITPVTLTPTQRVGTALPVPATELGVVGGRSCFGVSPAGTVVTPAAVVVDWWIGAEDRWHLVPDEAAVRQGLGDDGVVIETRCKIPGGDVVHRIAAVPSGGSVLARVEIENATPVPVAVAAVIRVPAAGPIVVDTDAIVVDGAAVVRAGRSIARALVAADLPDAFRRTAAGEAVPVAALGDTAGTVAVAIFPLPHTATLRLAIASGPDDAVPVPDDLPPFDAVARGWERHLDVGARIMIPDDRLERAVAAARRQLLAAAGGAVDDGWATDEPWSAPVAAVALDAWGHHGEGLDLLLTASGTDDLAVHATRPIAEAGALVWAWAERLERRPDPELSAAVAPMIEELALRLLARPRRRLFARSAEAAPAADAEGWRAVGLAAAASLLSRVGEGIAGADIVDALPRLVAGLDPADAALPLALGGRRLGSLVGPVPSVAAVALGRAARNGTGPADRAAERGQRAATVDDLVALAAMTSPTGALDDGSGRHERGASALLALGVARALVDEPDGAGGPVALLSGLPTSWAGATIEWHELAVTGGVVSCAVRWHGPRPALLWEVAASVHPAVLTAPTLDPDWRHETATADRAPDGTWKGEALLAPTPGLESSAMESPEVRRGERVDPTDEPGSFA